MEGLKKKQSCKSPDCAAGPAQVSTIKTIQSELSLKTQRFPAARRTAHSHKSSVTARAVLPAK